MALRPPRTLAPLSEEAKRRLTERAASMIEELRRLGGATDGAVTRLVYTPEWLAAMEQVERWFDDFGLSRRVDAVGSRFGRLAGVDSDVVLTGSHIDSVRHGGAYDGALGIIMATLALGWLGEECGRPRRSIEVLANCEEESSRFPDNFWGARAMMGLIRPEEPDELRDADGVSIGDAMRACGLDPSTIQEARRSDIIAFIEAHIEQGTRLESSNNVVGVVERVVGVRQMGVRLVGSSGHAGTIPMDHRRDAMVAAAEVILNVKQTAVRIGDGAVATVGGIHALPGGTNQIAEEVRLTVDFRHSDNTVLDLMERELRVGGRNASDRYSVSISDEVWLSQRPIDFDVTVRDVIEQACEATNCAWMRLESGAGHDAQVIAQKFPSGMLFVPSKGGHSHRPDEETTIEDITAGTEVLIRALHHLAYVR